jgi:hypothetical protein
VKLLALTGVDLGQAVAGAFLAGICLVALQGLFIRAFKRQGRG